MALVKCEECFKEMSTRADKCPNCGAPYKKVIGCSTIIIAAIIAILAFSTIVLILKSQSEKRKQAEAARAKVKVEARPIFSERNKKKGNRN